MIVVIDEDAARRDVVEAVLAQRRFAVAQFYSVEQALRSLRTLRPQAVVASAAVAATLRVKRGPGPAGRPIPTVPVTSRTVQPDRLVGSLRRLLRRAR
jgi:CheY-like chemotaxis protein